MFPRRFFAGRYFAPRYYPQSLGSAPPSGSADFNLLGVGPGLGLGL